jgi:hypothetical protein
VLKKFYSIEGGIVFFVELSNAEIVAFVGLVSELGEYTVDS